MDTDKKKELRAAYKERPREAGVVFVTCGATGEMFLADVVDSPAAFNRMRFSCRRGFTRTSGCKPSGISAAKTPSSSACCSVSTPATRIRTSPRSLKTLLDLCLAEHPEATKPKAAHGARRR